MTTKLEGENTTFLPFNQGSEGAGKAGGKGNPINQTEGFSIDYLWQRVLTRDSLLSIIGDLLLVVTKDSNLQNLPKEKYKLIFPRFHQLDVVQKISQDVKKRGVGNRYLVQHSAGSGKSNSIAWLAYNLMSLHDNNDNAIFTSIIVISDRKILNNQLRATLAQFNDIDGLLKEAKTGEDLKNAISLEKKVIISTIQKFNFSASHIEGQANRKFAIIVDEAHSSQDGKNKDSMLDILNSYLQENEKIILNNISIFAFTATPRPKTLEIFGTEINGKKIAFHTYSMRQAIEEGFILDVLQNYLPYKVYAEVKSKTDEDPQVKVDLVKKEIKTKIAADQKSIDLKSKIIVNHLLESVIQKINGKAKAMLVTSSRELAVRYYYAIKKILANTDPNVGVLVAFSEKVATEKQNKNEVGEGDLNEHGIAGDKIAMAFNNTDKYNFRLLIVANKFQVGFDQPLLQTMYVDKSLDDVAAVQTLSRLNRICLGKEDTFILDFGDNAARIQAAFQQYYTDLNLISELDPNKINIIKDALDNTMTSNYERIYSEEDVKEVYQLYIQQCNNVSGQHTFVKGSPKIQKSFLRYRKLEEEQQIEFKLNIKNFLNLFSLLTNMLELVHREELIPFANYYQELSHFINNPTSGLNKANFVDYITVNKIKIVKQEAQKLSLTNKDIELNHKVGNAKLAPEIQEENLSVIISNFNEENATNFKEDVIELLVELTLNDSEIRNALENIDNDLDNIRLIWQEKNNLGRIISKNTLKDYPDIYERYSTDKEFKKSFDSLIISQCVKLVRG